MKVRDILLIGGITVVHAYTRAHDDIIVIAARVRDDIIVIAARVHDDIIVIAVKY